MTRRETFEVTGEARLDSETRSGSVDVRVGAAGRVSGEIDSSAPNDARRSSGTGVPSAQPAAAVMAQ